MKKLIKILVVAFTLALLAGAVFAFSASAEETSQPVAQNEGPWVVSKNVSYEENTHLFFAIDAAVATDSSKITLSVLDASGNVLAEGLTVSKQNEDIYEDGSKICHIVKTPGVAAKDYADVLTINVYYDGSAEPVESTTYSVAEYFLERLYKNGVVDATDAYSLSQKKLYFASLRYGAAAQKLLAPSDTVLVDNLIYVMSPAFTGVTCKGYVLELDDENFKFDYFSNTNKGVDFHVSGEAGYYVLDESVNITNVTPASKAPAGAASFENLTPSDTDIGPKVNSYYQTIEGGVDGAVGLKSVGSWSQKAAWQEITVGQDGENKFVRNKVTEKDGTLSHTIEVQRDTSTAGDVLVFQARMRTNFSSGNNQIRVMKGRGNGGGARHQFGTIGTLYGGDWFTMRVVMTNNPNGGIDFTLSRGADTSSLVVQSTGTIKTLNDGKSVSSITELNAFVMMLNTTCVGYCDWDYVFFTTVENLAAVDKLADIDTVDVTLAPSAYLYTNTSFKDHVIESGATLSDANASAYTQVYASVKSEENGNKYVSISDNGYSQQAQLHFKNSNNLTDKDTLTLKFDMRMNKLADGTFLCNEASAGVEIRVRTSSSASTKNVAQVTFHVGSKGELVVSDYKAQKVQSSVVTEIDPTKWFTVSVTYTSKGEASKVVVTDGVHSHDLTAVVYDSTFAVDIADITSMSIYNYRDFMGILDIDNLSITASKSAQ